MGSRFPVAREKANEFESITAESDDDFVPCDICDQPVETDDGFRLSGRGLYATAREGRLTFDEAPICANCSTGIGVFVFQQWMAREEEG